MVSQAGVGGNVAYGRAGVVELGGSAAVRSDPGVFSIIVAPSVGWFFQDNLELSGILDFNFQNLTGSASNTTARLLVEPSYHLPFNQTTFGFIGIGVGLGFNSSVGATSPVGFALAPRLGMNFLVGRSGVFTPALFVNYSTVSLATTGNTATLAVTPSYGLQLGYTVML